MSVIYFGKLHIVTSLGTRRFAVIRVRIAPYFTRWLSIRKSNLVRGNCRRCIS